MTLPTTFWGWIQLLIDKYGPLFLNGAGFTMLIAISGTVLGFLLGLLVAIVRTIPVSKKDNIFKRILMKLVNVILNVYIEVFRGTPMIVQAMVIFYGSMMYLGLRMPALGAAIFIISINTGAYMAESVRGGIISIDPGQTEGAKAIGMTHVQTMINVILPQALRNIMPQIGNNFIINVKDTSVMFIIGFPDFFAAHRAAVGASYLYFPSATVEMVGYLTMTLVASFLLRWVEKKLDGNSDYELVQVDQLTMTAGTYSHPDRGTPFDEKSKEFHSAKEERRERREKKLLELRYGRPKGDR